MVAAVSLTTEQLASVLAWAGLVDMALLYVRLIWRRAEQRRAVREGQEVGLRSLVRVMLVDTEQRRPRRTG